MSRKIEDNHIIFDTPIADEMRRIIGAADELGLCYTVTKLSTLGRVYKARFSDSGYARLHKDDELTIFWIVAIEIGPL